MNDLAALRAYVDNEVTDWPNHDPSESFDEGWDAAKASCLNAIERYAAGVRVGEDAGHVLHGLDGEPKACAACVASLDADLREAAQAVMDAWDTDGATEEDGFDPMVYGMDRLRAVLATTKLGTGR